MHHALNFASLQISIKGYNLKVKVKVIIYYIVTLGDLVLGSELDHTLYRCLVLKVDVYLKKLGGK